MILMELTINYKRKGMVLPELCDKGMQKQTHAKYAQANAQKRKDMTNKMNPLELWSKGLIFSYTPYSDENHAFSPVHSTQP